jgi:S-DNA-T family DNA segregation ATPase FtsK/SpoIIIE
MNRKTTYFVVLWLLALSVFLAVGFSTMHEGDWPFSTGETLQEVENLSGPLGSLLAQVCFGLLGTLFAWIIPVMLLVFAGAVISGRKRECGRFIVKSAAVVLLLSSLFALLPYTGRSDALSGSLAQSVAAALTTVLGEVGGTILLVTCLLLVLLSELRYFSRVTVGSLKGAPAVYRLLLGAGRGLGRAAAALYLMTATSLASWRKRRRARVAVQEASPKEEVGTRSVDITVEPAWPEAVVPERHQPARLRQDKAARQRPAPKPASMNRVPGSGAPIEDAKLPALSVLQSGHEHSAYSPDRLKNWSEVLENKLAVYGIVGKVTAVNQGPMVATFEFEPAAGVKVKDIVSRADDLALAMRAKSLRLIAPIPGRAVVGIEIPNPEGQTVYFHDVLREIPERLRLSGIMLALGVDATGKPFYTNLCGAPHLLMAGTTGSGKSVSLNCILSSILFQYRPSDVRLLLVDPKMVELSMYNGIPHLLHPVITDPKEAVRVFTYLIAEMERRNELFREAGVKNIESFNSKVALGKIDKEELNEKLHYIVLVVDELGDLILTKGMDIESLLSRLSNMARAVGIHMIVATQRPSVDVIVGKTKANFPTRIAFRVASKVDSRTILDRGGADKLLGRGDMLYMDAKHPEPVRLHGPWLSEEELEQLVNHWTQYEYEESRLDLFQQQRNSYQGDERDPYFGDAKEIVFHYQQGSTSLLQRRLHIGYARAARLLDQLEQAGIVGPPEGSKPREVLVKEREEVRPGLED